MLAWHRHEMPFGFAAAIIAGFLLTAVPNWTGRPGLNGWPLIGLVLVWVLARLAWLLPIAPAGLLLLQLPFLPLLAWVLGRDLVAAGKRENYPILLMITLLAGCQAMTLWGLSTDDVGLQRRGVLAALWLVAALMSVIGGRVIRFFIQRSLNRPASPAANPWPTRVLVVCGLFAALTFALGDAATEPGHSFTGGWGNWRVDSGDDFPGQPGAYRAGAAAVGSHHCGICPGVERRRGAGVAGAVFRVGIGVVGVALVYCVWAVFARLYGGLKPRL